MKKQYSIDIKIQAVLKAERPGILAEHVAQELGIHPFSLSRWKKELREAGLLNKMPKKNTITTDLSLLAQVEQLKKENAHLKMENAVLKKLKEIGNARKKTPSK